MRILFINCNPDLSHYTSKGLVFDTEYKTISQKFPTFKVGTKQTSTGQNYDLYTPDVSDYVDTIKDKYSLVIVGYNPADYGAEFNGTGGYSCKIPSKTGIFWATVRIDPYVNHYIIHELSHLLCTLVFRRFGKIVGDFMDSTIVNGVSMPYYKDNDENAPDGNFAITWKGIQPFISQLNNLDMYKYFRDSEVVGLKPELVQMLDKARGIAGVPFIITSGLRTVQDNESVGGVSDSSHLNGYGCDLSVVDSDKRYKILTSLLQVGFNRIGVYGGHIHTDCDTTLPANMIWYKNTL